MKKIKFLVPILLATSLTPVVALVGCSKKEEEIQENELEYSINIGTDTVMVRGYANNQEEHEPNLVIPESVVLNGTTYQVTSIDEEAFKDALNIQSVEMADSIVNIGPYAFNGCKNLETIKLSSNLTILHHGLFASCTSLKEINIPASVWQIEQPVFADCPALSKITVDPENKKYYSKIDGEEQNCVLTPYMSSGVELVCGINTIPQQVTIVGKHSFFNNRKLTTIEIPENVEYIRESSFQGCDELGSVIFKNGSKIERIQKNAFADCLKLRYVSYDDSANSFPDGLKYIEENAFSNTGLMLIELNEGLEGIEDMAFSYCSNLISAKIPASLTELGNGVFSGCNELSLSVDTENSKYTSQDEMDNECNCIMNKNGRKIIYQGTKSIEWDLLPSTISQIYNYAFYGFDFTTIALPDSITNIGEYAFAECRKLETITFGDNLLLIGNKAFSNDSNISSIFVPKTTETLYSTAFDGCTKLVDIRVDEKNDVYSSRDESGIECHCIWSKSQQQLIQGTSRTRIPDTIMTIRNNAFYNISNLHYAIFPATLKEIQDNAFTSCSQLTLFAYMGSVEQWKENVTRGNDWHQYCPAEQIYCIDGETITPAPLDPE